jgi:hypothetical protein
LQLNLVFFDKVQKRFIVKKKQNTTINISRRQPFGHQAITRFYEQKLRIVNLCMLVKMNQALCAVLQKTKYILLERYFIFVATVRDVIVIYTQFMVGCCQVLGEYLCGHGVCTSCKVK